jgi:hypothetical protein
MKQFTLKSIYPHLIPVGTFFLISALLCLPALQGMVLEQYDMLAGEGMIKNSKDHQLIYGNLPLWNTNMFGGMPNFQILFSWDTPLLNIRKILALGLPKPADFFFISCVSFYILVLTFNMKPYISMLSALSYAFACYNPGIINAGHDTKMLTLAYAPGVIAGFQLIFNKKYWIGLAVATLYMILELTANHPQITYYLAFVILFMGLTYLIQWIKKGEWLEMGKSILCILITIIIGLGNAAPTLMNTIDYAKYTIRGGKDIESKDGTLHSVKTKGLDYDYASMWSIRKSEVLTLFMPDAFGGTSSDPLPSTSKFIDHLTQNNIPVNYAEQLAGQLPGYWGGLESTQSSNYLGVITFMLFILGMIFLKTQDKWWILASVIMGLILACGKYFSEINEFIFNTLPFYNKFRAPSMALVIPQMVIPLMAGLFLDGMIKNTIKIDKKIFLKNLAYCIAGTLVLLGIIYIFNDYGSQGIDTQISEAFRAQQEGTIPISKIILEGLVAERKAMFLSAIMRVLIFCIIIAALLYMHVQKIIGPMLLAILLIVINTFDLINLDKKFLNEKNYIDGDLYISNNFTPTSADQFILQDKDPHFRVYNLSADRFSESKTSFFHRSIGGYHAAKLRNYQDVIETKFSEPGMNKNVINMLDTKYFIIPPQTENGTYSVQKNDEALGAAWFIQNLKQVNNTVEELKELDSINPATTAVIEKNQGLKTITFQKDSSSSIQLVRYRNDTSVFETDTKSNQYAVFSEIYYPNGWNAYIDGKKTSFQKVNYILRGMEIPMGKHKIEFIFEPETYKLSSKIANFSGWAFYVILAITLLVGYMNYKKKMVI